MIIDCHNAAYYRPTQNFSYLLTWQISSEPWFFHIVNLFYFLTAAFLVFVLIKKLTNNFFISFLTALFFLVHPINSEVVNWVAAVPELLLAVFVLLSTIYFIKYREANSLKHLIFSALFYFFALLSKEPAILLPAVFLLIDWALFKIKIFKYAPKEHTIAQDDSPQKEFLFGENPEPQFLLLPAPSQKEDFDIGLIINFKEIKTYLFFFFSGLAFLSMRFLVLGEITGSPQPYFGVFSLSERIYAFFVLFGQYIIKLFYPNPLLFTYFFEKKTDFLSPGFLISFLASLTGLIAAIYLLKKKIILPAVFSVWIFIFLFPAIFFIDFAGDDLFSERYLFVPSIGFAFLLAYIFNYLAENKKTVRIFLLPLIILMIAGSWYVIFPRNKVFQNDETLYKDTLAVNPLAHAIRRNLAVELMEGGRYEEAKSELEKILQLAPDWWEIDKVYNQLGDYYRLSGDFNKAGEYYNQSIKVSKGLNYKPFNNLGAAYLEKGNYLAALTYLCRAMVLAPDSPETNVNFSKALYSIESAGQKELYSDIVKGDIFKKSGEKAIRHKETVCQNDGCSFVFSSEIRGGEILLPFLILASTSKNEIIRAGEEGRIFDPEKGLIVVKLAAGYENQPLTFIFPTCQGIYYEALAE